VPNRPTVAFLVRDITQQKMMEQRLIQADRLASLGTLAAGVAHEVNNPLSYVSSNLHFIAESLTAVRRALSGEAGVVDVASVERMLGECAEALGEAQEGTTRIRHVVGDLKTFARGQESEEGLANVKRALESSLSLVLPELRFRARLNRHLDEVPLVRGNEARLGQVFLNLLINASQAIELGAPERNQVDVHLREEGAWVVIEVQDTGAGMPAEVLEHLFEPFVTTRPGSTGMGLPVSHAIITSLGGALRAESKPGEGTVFTITLPAAGTPVAGPLPPEHELAS